MAGSPQQLGYSPLQEPRFRADISGVFRSLPTGVFDGLSDAMLALDGRRRIIWCNRSAERLFGRPLGELRNIAFTDLAQCDVPDGSESGEVAQATIGPALSNGIARFIEVSFFLVSEVDGWFVIAREHADRECLAAALNDRERFDALLAELSEQFNETLEDEINSVIASALGRLVAFLGVSRSSLAELTREGALLVTHSYAVPGVRPYPRHVADDRLPWLVSEMRAGRTIVLTKVQDLPAEAELEREMMTSGGMRSGIAIPLHVGKSLVCVLSFGDFQNEREWPAELISRLRVAGEIFANAIARRQGKEHLQLKQRELTHLGRVMAMSELASVIAHELDQPLTAIITNAQASRHLLNQDKPDLKESTAALDDIIADAMRASEIVHRERRLLRRGQRNVEPLDVNDAIREIELFIRADARQHGSAVRFELSSRVSKIQGDRVQLQQVLLNLTRNAIQAMSAQPREMRILHVTSRRGSDAVFVEVRDAGVAIDEASLARMFEPFYTTKADGLGMGLSISRSIIEAHCGRIWASRNLSGPGLTFHVELPMKIQGCHAKQQ
jgi:C4-dicarboxylate-specific signal transduction histidine kinase